MSPNAARPHPGADMEGFVRAQMAFVGLGEADAELIRRTAPVVLDHGDALTAALYEHFLQSPDSARFFLRDDGSPDRERIERDRKSTRLNSSHLGISYAVFCLKKKKIQIKKHQIY